MGRGVSVTSASLRPVLHTALARYSSASAQHERPNSKNKHAKHSAHPRSAEFQSRIHLLNLRVVMHVVLLLA
jgi:hypothetical protein